MVEKNSNEELRSRPEKIETPKKVVLVAALFVIIGFAVLLRTIHLLDGNYYYIIGPNSFLYNRMAELIISGVPPLPIPEATGITSIGGSGLAYPLAYTAYMLAFIFHTSTMDGLMLAGDILPIAITIATLLLMYFMVSKTNNWVAAVFSAFAMAVIPSIYLIQAAGYLDHYALSLLLIMVGVFAYYFLRKWHFKRGSNDLAWIIGALLILGIEFLLFLEWNFGPFVMITIISGCFVLEFLGYFLQDFLKGYSFRVLTLLLRDAEFVSAGLKKAPKRFDSAIKQINWKLFILFFLVNVIVAVLFPGLLQLGANIEAQNYSIVIANVVVNYNILLIPLLFGFFAALKVRREGDIFWLGWFFTATILTFFNLQLLIFVAPAAAVLIARSLAPVARFRTLGWKAKTVLTLLMIIIIFLSFAAYDLATVQGSPDNNWNQALIWCNQYTPQNATILTWSGNAYWVIDIAHRTPVFGYSGLTADQARDLALVYSTNDSNTIIRIMNKYGASYLIFSKDEVAVLPQLSNNSVYNSIVFENLTFNGLTKIPQNQQEVVVLKLESN